MTRRIFAGFLVVALSLVMVAGASFAEDADDIDLAALVEQEGWGTADDLFDSYGTGDEDEDDETIGDTAGDLDGEGQPLEEEAFLDELVARIEQSAQQLDAIDGMINILLVGLDARPGQKTGRSDTMILMTLDSDNKCIKMISFMRDLYVEIPGKKNNRLNAAYVFGGPDLLKRTLKHNFGVSVDYYVAVDFSLLADVIDQIGGLEVTVDPKYVKRINAVIKMDNKVLGIDIDDGLLSEGGRQLLTGKQTEAYARYRYGSSDFDRVTRQREVILKSMDKLKSMQLKDLAALALNNIERVSTDMTLSDMVQIAPIAFELLDAEVRQMRVPIDELYASKTISGMSVLVPNRSKTLSKITGFLLD
ncbi:MAG: LCP family protein [Christensenellales bacterium]|jgi:LCP family protein required for cell wall assembly